MKLCEKLVWLYMTGQINYFMYSYTTGSTTSCSIRFVRVRSLGSLLRRPKLSDRGYYGTTGGSSTTRFVYCMLIGPARLIF